VVTYQPPLPDSLVKVDDNMSENTDINSGGNNVPILEKLKYTNNGKDDSSYGNVKRDTFKKQRYDPPLPDSLINVDNNKSENTDINSGGNNVDSVYNNACNGEDNYSFKYTENGRKKGEPVYDPPLPDSLLEVKSSRGKHSTEKPVDLMKWILKYYSKEGDYVLDPTMGSGSMGVACKEVNRFFIGVEKDEDIFKVAESRIN